ncbi:hypothetical protein GCM10011390_14880 [Aureimonas endophytica]|uniref:Divergent polysaccharide deacetylase family protein n=1 Tax=Aureimonas endophytica TaxID=2027858 RepID=A0A916ZGV8_9HYPH|nr:divergent polysaccharide deacetylase family protein [Aureimonas endophytica]GGD97143.1 hypothetical protein GCM10011390_14880 [Aureimonas endophytica]
MDDLYRPLGLDSPHRAWRLPAVRLDRLVLMLAVGGILGGSAAISLDRPVLRQVDVFAEQAEREAAAEMAAALPSPPEPAVKAAPLQPLGRSSAPEDSADPNLPTVSYPPNLSGDYGRLVPVRDPGSLRQAPGEADKVDEALTEPGEEGPLPVRAADGRRPFDVYQAEPASDRGTRIAIVVGGLGISQTGTMRAVEQLPPAVTLAFAAAGNSLDRWMRQARRSGHELLLQLPMEPTGYPDVSPGAHTLTAKDAAGRRWRDLDWSLGRLTNYVGVMNYMGARLTGDAEAMPALATELARRGLLYLDDGTSARSLARDAAKQAGAVYAGADILLDAQQDPDSIRRRLDALERTARAGGRAIGVASAFESSIATLGAWIREAEGRGIVIVPVSALADDPEAR